MLSQISSWVRRSPLLERAARRLLDKRYQLAVRHLRGTGLEIGALDRPLMLPQAARAFYLDRMLPLDLREHYPELGSRVFYVSVVADGESLACFSDHSLDFIIANHVIEHCQDPIATLITFGSKLKAGGNVFMAVPDLRRTFDRNRTETSWEHLLGDHTNGPQQSRKQHYREWAECVQGLSGDEAVQRAAELEAIDYSIHYHCWTESGFISFLNSVRTFVPLEILARASWRDENVFVLGWMGSKET